MTDFWYRTSLAILPPLVAGLMRLWFASCRLKELGEKTSYTAIEKNEQLIAAFWHYSFFYLFYYLRKRKAAVMVSASKDGEYIARLAQNFGHVPVRGSSNTRGFRALREMLTALQEGQSVGIVADGSQGPPRKVQPGVILMASRSKIPICPMAWAASRYISFKSWDRTVLPLPFSTIVLKLGDLFHVPPDLTADEVKAYSAQLEDHLNILYNEVWQSVGQGPHDSEVYFTVHTDLNKPSGGLKP